MNIAFQKKETPATGDVSGGSSIVWQRPVMEETESLLPEGRHPSFNALGFWPVVGFFLRRGLFLLRLFWCIVVCTLFGKGGCSCLLR